MNCPDCGAAPGELHHYGCDVERCPDCGSQLISCDCTTFYDPLPWTGDWPGEAECIVFGWYARRVPGTRGWTACDKDDLGAGPDLNRLSRDAVWNPSTRQWEKK